MWPSMRVRHCSIRDRPAGVATSYQLMEYRPMLCVDESRPKMTNNHLDLPRAQGAIFARSSLSAPWAFEFPDETTVQFHIVLDGKCWLRMAGCAPTPLTGGEVAVVLATESYQLAADPDEPAKPFAPLRDAARRERSLTWSGVGPTTELICGAYALDQELAPAVLYRLPPTMTVAWRSDVLLRTTVSLLSAELRHPRGRSQLVVDRFVDVLFAQILRAWLELRAKAPGRRRIVSSTQQSPNLWPTFIGTPNADGPSTHSPLRCTCPALRSRDASLRRSESRQWRMSPRCECHSRRTC